MSVGRRWWVISRCPCPCGGRRGGSRVYPGGGASSSRTSWFIASSSSLEPSASFSAAGFAGVYTGGSSNLSSPSTDVAVVTWQKGQYFANRGLRVRQSAQTRREQQGRRRGGGENVGRMVAQVLQVGGGREVMVALCAVVVVGGRRCWVVRVAEAAVAWLDGYIGVGDKIAIRSGTEIAMVGRATCDPCMWSHDRQGACIKVRLRGVTGVVRLIIRDLSAMIDIFYMQGCGLCPECPDRIPMPYHAVTIPRAPIPIKSPRKTSLAPANMPRCCTVSKCAKAGLSQSNQPK